MLLARHIVLVMRSMCETPERHAAYVRNHLNEAARRTEHDRFLRCRRIWATVRSLRKLRGLPIDNAPETWTFPAKLAAMRG